VPRPEIYAAIYRMVRSGGGSDGSYVLADYRAVPARSEPTFASVVLATPGSPPLIRDGYDLLEPGGRTLSIARLRRFDGQRFRTLLTFCAHRVEPVAGGSPREGLNRVEFVDVDKDGNKEVVVLGLVRPTVFKVSDNGLLLSEDAPLTQLYLASNAEAQRSRALHAEAQRYSASGQFRRAADTLLRAYSLAPYDLELGSELVEALLGSDQPGRAVEVLARMKNQAPERAALSCAQARAERALRNVPAELLALKVCVEHEPDMAQRSAALLRLRELQPPGSEPGQGPGAVSGAGQQPYLDP
jgi:hypothetical protein